MRVGWVGRGALAALVTVRLCGCGADGGAESADGAIPRGDAITPIDGVVGGGASDARPDADTDAGGSVVDAGVPDAAPPDAPPDAPPPDASCVAPLDDGSDPNPFGIHFTNVSPSMPVLEGGRINPDPWAFGSGVAVGDLDGDGDLDLALSRADNPGSVRPGGRSTILWNDGRAGGFVTLREDLDVPTLTALRTCHGAATVDLEPDGDLDVIFACEGPEIVLENDGAGHFANVAAALGLEGPSSPDKSSNVIVADVNLDGISDLVVLSFATTYPVRPLATLHNRLYLGRGGGRYEDVSVVANAEGLGASHASLVANLDRDPALEIFVSDDRFGAAGTGADMTVTGDQFLDPSGFDAAGVPVYLDRGREHGFSGPWSTMGVALGDLDGDGAEDLYTTDIGPNHVYLWYAPASTFLDDFGRLGLDLPKTSTGAWFISWAPHIFDLDRDGRPELSVVTGEIGESYSCSAQAQRDWLLRANPSWSYADITVGAGLAGVEGCPAPSGPLNGRAAVPADLDGDGDDDLVVTPYIEAFTFFRNDTPACARPRLRVRPIGTVSSPEAAGTRLHVELSDGRVIERTMVGGGDTYSQADRVLEVGLDGREADEVVEARLEWPSGLEQRIDLLPGFAGRTHAAGAWTIEEPRWLTVSARSIAPGETAEIVYTRVDAAGAPRGAAGAGGVITASTQRRDDGSSAETTAPLAVEDLGNGSYRMSVVHGGTAGWIRVTISDPERGIDLAPVIRVGP